MMVLWLVIAAAATWRVTSLLARERGPLAVCMRLRMLLGVHHLPDGTPEWGEGEVLLNPVTRWERIDSVLHEVAWGLTCTWCASVWVSLVFALLLRGVAPELVTDVTSYVLVVLALSTGVIIIDHFIG